MKKVNGYRNFSFGDIIIIVDENAKQEYRNKEFKFIAVDGEDYLFYDSKNKDTICIRAYYFNTFKKVAEKQKKITTWELSYKKKQQ